MPAELVWAGVETAVARGVSDADLASLVAGVWVDEFTAAEHPSKPKATRAQTSGSRGCTRPLFPGAPSSAAAALWLPGGASSGVAAKINQTMDPARAIGARVPATIGA